MTMHNPPHPGEFITAIYPEPHGVRGRELTRPVVSQRLQDFRVPGGKRPELLRSDQAGQYSILISGQLRGCFVQADE